MSKEDKEDRERCVVCGTPNDRTLCKNCDPMVEVKKKQKRRRDIRKVKPDEKFHDMKLEQKQEFKKREKKHKKHRDAQDRFIKHNQQTLQESESNE